MTVIPRWNHYGEEGEVACRREGAEHIELASDRSSQDAGSAPERTRRHARGPGCSQMDASAPWLTPAPALLVALFTGCGNDVRELRSELSGRLDDA